MESRTGHRANAHRAELLREVSSEKENRGRRRSALEGRAHLPLVPSPVEIDQLIGGRSLSLGRLVFCLRLFRCLCSVDGLWETELKGKMEEHIVSSP